MSTSEVLARITSALDKAGIPYMLTGSLASTHYGAARSTLNIDIVIDASPAQLSRFVQSLATAHYCADLDSALEAHSQHSLFNVIDMETGWKIDLIIRKPRPFSQVEFNRRQKINVQGVEIFVASVEDVIIAKLEWAKISESKRQLEDVALTLKLRWETLDQSYLREWGSRLGLHQQWDSAKQSAAIS